MKLRYFSVDEAESCLRIITDIFRQAQETKKHIEEKIDKWRRERKKMSPADEAVIRGQVDFLANQLERQLGQIMDLGCSPKDLDVGLVDFPTRIDGKEAYLCWKIGESKIRYWHGLTDGFKGRRLIKKRKKK